MRHNTALNRVIAVLMSFALVMVSLIPFAWGSRNAYAEPMPYTPLPEKVPAYTGPLSWMNYTAPQSTVPIPGTGYISYALDIDHNDHVFVTKISGILNGPGKVEKISDDGQTVTDITYDAALKYPMGIATDKDGNVYVADNSQLVIDSNSARILMLPYGEHSWVEITQGSAIKYALGVAVDRLGNVYAVDSSLNNVSPTPRILKLPNGSKTWVDISETSSPFVLPFNVAVDGEGNVFINDLGNGGINAGKIYKLPAGATTWVDVSPASVVGAVPFLAQGVGVDKFDNVYATSALGGIKKLGYNGGSNNWRDVEIKSNPLSGLIFFDVAADSSGYLYSTNFANGNIIRLLAEVLYDGNGQTGGTAPVDEVGYKADTPAIVKGNTGNLVKTGHLFDGWSKAANVTGATYAPGDLIHVTQNITLYAVWAPIVKVTYNGNGHTSGSVPVDAEDYKQGQLAFVHSNTGNLAKTGYVFDGWNTAANGTGDTYAPGDTTNVTENITLYAVWSPIAKVTYSGNGHTSGSVPVDAEDYKQGQTATVHTNTGNLAKTGYVFDGWNTAANGTGDTYAPGDTIHVTESITLYAVWAPIVKVTYNGNGHTGGSVPVDAEDYKQGQLAFVHSNTGNLAKTGYVFDGWNTAANGEGDTYAPGDTISMTQNVMLFARWKPIPSYTVTFQAAAGGSISAPGSEMVYGGSSPSSVPAVTPDPGFTFLGWSDDGGATLLSDVQVTSSIVNRDITYMAYFKPLVTLTSLILDSIEYTLEIGDTHQSVVTAVYSDHSEITLLSGVTYSSSNTAVATVDGTGLVTAREEGEAVIIAEYEGAQAQATVSVYSVPSESSGNSGTSGNSAPGIPPANPGFEVLLDGVRQGQLATVRQEQKDGQTVSTVVLDSRKVIDRLEHDDSKLLTIPVSGSSQVVVSQLTGDLVKALESKEAQIRIVTDRAVFTLPAALIDIDGMFAQFGSDASLGDMTVRIQISEASPEQAARVQAAAGRSGVETIVSPVDFDITISYGAQTVQANSFNDYVGRMIAIPEGTDANQITTGVVLSSNGDLFHVPTVIVKQDGKMYALINSLTNSTYSVIYSPREMKDVESHWAKTDVNDMSSRLIVQGVTETEFRPDTLLTRAEFAAILTRGLGIQGAPYAASFTDVGVDNWYSGAVQAAVNYELIDGYEDGTFRPNQTISRQEAAVVLARAMRVANLKSELTAVEVNRVLSAFTDGSEAAGWARTDVAAAVSLRIMNGRSDKLDLDANLTRAEAAALVRRLLQAANLINP